MGRTTVILGYFKKPFFALITGRTIENRCPFTKYGCIGFLSVVEQDGYSEWDPMDRQVICSHCSSLFMGSPTAKRVLNPREISVWKIRRVSEGTRLKIQLNKTEAQIVAAIRSGRISIA